MRNRKLTSTLGGALITLPLATLAEPEQSGDLEVEQITVTAQKRGEDLQEVPLALSVLGSKELERENIQSFQDLQYSVPNLSMVARSPFTTTLNMRGVPSNPNGVFNAGTSPGMGIYVDGVVYARATGFNQDLSNIQQVEVLRGPQGTLFGQNTNLGVVNITTKKPSEFPEVKVKADTGSLDLKRINAYVSGPLGSDDLAASLSLFAVDKSGYQTNLTDGGDLGSEDRRGGRAQFRYNPHIDLTLDLNLEYLKDEATPQSHRLVGYQTGLGFLGLYGQGELPDNYFSKDPDEVAINGEHNYSQRESRGVDLTLSYEFGRGFEFKSITAKKDYDAHIGLDTDFTPVALNFSYESEQNQQVTQEFQLISPKEQSLRYVLGLYYLNNESTNVQAFQTGTGIYGIPTGLPDGYPQSLNLLPGAGVFLDGSLQTQSRAAFANVNYDLSEALNLFVGLRYSAVTKEMRFTQDGYDTSIPGVYLLDYIDIETREQRMSDNFLSWSTGASYAIGTRAHLYGKISRGYKEGGYSFRPQSLAAIGGDPNNPEMDFAREAVISYELGWKSDLLARRMRLNLALFYLDYTDIQTQVVDDNGVNRVVNGPSATSQGIEAELTYRFTPELTLNGSVGFADASFDDFANCHATDDCTGNQLPGAARWTNQIALSYNQSAWAGWELFAGLSYSYRSKVQSDARNLKATELDQASLVNGQLGLISDDGTWELMLWGKNLFDERYRVSRQDAATSDLSFTAEMFAPPRSLGITLSYNYF